MNLFDALNEGDASLKEPHITSVLYYLFIKTYESNKGNSLIKYFLKFNLGIELENYIEIDDKKLDHEHTYRKFTYKAMATRDCWKELLKLIEDGK